MASFHVTPSGIEPGVELKDRGGYYPPKAEVPCGKKPERRSSSPDGVGDGEQGAGSEGAGSEGAGPLHVSSLLVAEQE